MKGTQEMTTNETLVETRDDPRKPVKAIYAAIIALLTGLLTTVEGGMNVTEIIVVTLAVAIAGGGVYGLPNPRVPDNRVPGNRPESKNRL